MADGERDRPHRDERASERVGEDEERAGQRGEGKGGPYGNPSHDEEALRKSQEEPRPKREHAQGSGS
jgi:hypothetical protein